MRDEDLRDITITYYANNDGLQKVVCEETEIDLDGVPEEVKKKWFSASGEIVGIALLTDITTMLNGNFEEEEEEEDEEVELQLSVDDVIAALFRSL